MSTAILYETAERETDNAKSQARAQYESICEYVAALECDYDRLAELRDERASLQDGDDLDALHAWDDENADELRELTAAATVDGDLLESREQAYERIQEDPLSIQIRSGWYTPGETPEPEQFEILLCTGGPACRILGELDEHKQPCRAWIEYQDWGTPWTQYFDASQDTLLTYASQFYFGE